MTRRKSKSIPKVTISIADGVSGDLVVLSVASDMTLADARAEILRQLAECEVEDNHATNRVWTVTDESGVIRFASHTFSVPDIVGYIGDDDILAAIRAERPIICQGNNHADH
jgi:hypothetical protein